MFYGIYERCQSQRATLENHPPLLEARQWPATYRGGVVFLEAQHWRLSVGGEVEAPFAMGLNELLGHFAKSHQFRRLVSAEGWTYRSQWEGIPLKQLVQQVRPRPTAKYLRQVNSLGQEETVRLASVLERDPLLVLRENGQPLSPLHGGPVRLLFFDRYDYKSLHHVTQLLFTETPGRSDYTLPGYPEDGQIESNRYYAFDLKAFRPIERPGEVTGY